MEGLKAILRLVVVRLIWEKYCVVFRSLAFFYNRRVS
jgi:hypothetical protein